MQESYGEDLASHTDPESWTAARKGGREALTGACAGGLGKIGPGDVQWMTAASGLVHEEFHGREFARRGGLFEMVQLWMNLPATDKMAPPRYQGIGSPRFPPGVSRTVRESYA